MMNLKFNRQDGIGLLELMLSLAIIAVLLIMATRYFQSTSQSQKVNQAVNDINAIQAAVANLKGADPSATPTSANISSYMPSDWNDGENINPWRGNYVVLPGVGQGATSADIQITITNIPEKACNALEPLVSGMLATGTAVCGSNNFTGTFGPAR